MNPVAIARGAAYLFFAYETAKSVAPQTVAGIEQYVGEKLDDALPEALDSMIEAMTGFKDGDRTGADVRPENIALAKQLRFMLEGVRAGGPVSDLWDVYAYQYLAAVFAPFSRRGFRRMVQLLANLQPDDRYALTLSKVDSVDSVLALVAQANGIVDPSATVAAMRAAQEALESAKP